MALWSWVYLFLLIAGAAALVAAVVLVLRPRRRPLPSAGQRDAARAMLDAQYARGEMDTTEYRDRVRGLDEP